MWSGYNSVACESSEAEVRNSTPENLSSSTPENEAPANKAKRVQESHQFGHAIRNDHTKGTRG